MNHQQVFKGSSSSGAVAAIGGGLEGKGAQFNNPRAGGSSGTAPPTPLTEALEQAEMLRRELNKVRVGFGWRLGTHPLYQHTFSKQIALCPHKPSYVTLSMQITTTSLRCLPCLSIHPCRFMRDWRCSLAQWNDSARWPPFSTNPSIPLLPPMLLHTSNS